MISIGLLIERLARRLTESTFKQRAARPDSGAASGPGPQQKTTTEATENLKHGEPREVPETWWGDASYYREHRERPDLRYVEHRYHVARGRPSEIGADHHYHGGHSSGWNTGREEASRLVEYWRAIALRKWSIVAITMAVAAIAFVVVSQIAPVYRSTAIVLIETDRMKLIPIGDAYGGVGAYYREYFQTQAEVLRSREVAQRVVANLKLSEHKEFDPRASQPSALQTWVGEHVPPLATLIWKSPPPLNDASIQAEVLKRYADRLSIEPVRQSQLIKVSFDAQDAKLAADVANATIQAYIQADVDAHSTLSKSASQQINVRLEELKAALDKSEKALQAYRDREGMLDNKSTVLGGIGRQLDELTQKLVDARVRRSEAEEAYNQVKAGEANNYESVPAVVKSVAVQRAKEGEAEAEKKVAEISQRYGPDHPKFAAAASDLSAARANTRRQIQNLVASVVKEYEAARATERTIQEALGQSKGAIQNLNRKEIQLGMLEREAASNRQLYQAFLSRFKETSATKDAPGTNARIIDAAVPALLPIRPNKPRTMLMATSLSLVLSAIAAVLLYRGHSTLRTNEDVEKNLHWPLLATLPILSRRTKKNRGQAVLDDPHDLYAESIRMASAGLLLSPGNVPHKILTITSSLLDEGKSTFAINFAYSQAKTKRVLLIEGDMRRPCFDKVLLLADQQKGLSELLSGDATLKDCLLRVEGTELHVITGGQVPGDPHELLVSRRFRSLLSALRPKYDMIVVDSPPVQLVSDALIIGAESTGVIFIVKADDTPVRLAQTVLRRIECANIPILGVVLNQQDFKKAQRYYGEYAGYAKYWYSSAGYGMKQ